jgi:hypothetical protein
VPRTRTPALGTPVTGTPATGTPATGAPAPATPRTLTPASGVPVATSLATGTPRTGTPATGVPVTPAPRTGTPATGVPVTATSATSATPPTRAPSSAAPRAKSDSIGDAFDNVMSQTPGGKQGVSTPEDLESVRKLFHDVAVGHVAQVRDVMLEFRSGNADPSWLESTKPALTSLRAMAAQIDLSDLCKALDQFCSTIDATVKKGSRFGDGDKTELLRRYQRLIELIPQAFELDEERDRREHIIVEALLFQVDGVERLTIDKLFAVGLNRLDTLTCAKPDDVVAVSGIQAPLAAAIVEQFRAYRAQTKAVVSVRDPAAERRELAGLLSSLAEQNDAFCRAENAWDDDARARKRSLRKQREQTFQRIKVTLARLGARDQLSRLERMPFRERIADLERYLQAESQVR